MKPAPRPALPPRASTRRALSRPSALALALALVATLASPAGPAQAAGNTLTVDVGSAVRPVTHVASSCP
jgi:ferric-dicitrate binding protein FerR (iron transport regulator)